MCRLAGEADRMPLDTVRSEHHPERQPELLQHRALLDMQLQIRGGVFKLLAGVARIFEVDIMLGQHLGQTPAVAVDEIEKVGWIHRAGSRTRAEQTASKASTFLVGPVDQ